MPAEFSRKCWLAAAQAAVLVCGQAPNLRDPALMADPLFAVSGATLCASPKSAASALSSIQEFQQPSLHHVCCQMQPAHSETVLSRRVVVRDRPFSANGRRALLRDGHSSSRHLGVCCRADGHFTWGSVMYGYLVYDTAFTAAFYRSLGSPSFLVHHGLGLACCCFGLYFNKCEPHIPVRSPSAMAQPGMILRWSSCDMNVVRLVASSEGWETALPVPCRGFMQPVERSKRASVCNSWSRFG